MFLDYSYFKENYKIIAIDLSKPHELDAGPWAIQQINFTANLDIAGNTTKFFIVEEAEETILDSRNRKNFMNAIPLNAKFNLIYISIK